MGLNIEEKLTPEERLSVEFAADGLTREHVSESLRILRLLAESDKVLTKRQIFHGRDPIHACTTGVECINYLFSRGRILSNGFVYYIDSDLRKYSFS